MINSMMAAGRRTCVVGLAAVGLLALSNPGRATDDPELVTFRSGDLQLKGFIWKPQGRGPFPAILWNHGSEKRPGAAEAVAPYFVDHGYVFFVPHREGQGRSPGRYIMDELKRANSNERKRLLVTLNEDHLQDQLAALKYLKGVDYVDPKRLVVMGASFGGIQTILALERDHGYRVAIACSASAQTWRKSRDLRERLKDAAAKATIPVFLFQADNDYDLEPNRALSDEIKRAGQSIKVKTYPAFGSSNREGHKFCWNGTSTWGPDAIAFIESVLEH